MIFNPVPNPIIIQTNRISQGTHSIYSSFPSFPVFLDVPTYVPDPVYYFLNQAIVNTPFELHYNSVEAVGFLYVSVGTWKSRLHILSTETGGFEPQGSLSQHPVFSFHVTAGTDSFHSFTLPPQPDYIRLQVFINILNGLVVAPYLVDAKLIYELTDSRLVPITLIEEYFYTPTDTYTNDFVLKPQIKDYFTGYSLDSNPYEINLDLILIPPRDGDIKIHFYFKEDETQNDCDGTAHRTISIQTWDLKLRKNINHRLKLKCIPCSISLEGDLLLCNEIGNQINSSHSRCFPSSLPIVKDEWDKLYKIKKAEVESNPKFLTSIELDTTPYIWAATPRWDQEVIPDRNTVQGIGEYTPNVLIYNKYFQLQLDGTYGTYNMPDSALLKLIGNSLDVQKWGVNPDDNTIPRIDNLGWRINRGNEVLGIRVKPDGTIDEELEDTDNRRSHAEGTERNDLQEYNPNCFASKGMLLRHLPNKFSPNPVKGTIHGGYRKVRDLPQILAEMHEQANAAMGYQEGTAIEIQLDGETYRYANQLALMTELFITTKQTAIYSKGAFFSSVIGEQSIKEVMGGLGLRTVDKYLEFKVADKVVKLYYKGISASQSVRRKLSAVATNVGMVIGNII